LLATSQAYFGFGTNVFARGSIGAQFFGADIPFEWRVAFCAQSIAVTEQSIFDIAKDRRVAECVASLAEFGHFDFGALAVGTGVSCAIFTFAENAL
jgi:hypothetical protein